MLVGRWLIRSASLLLPYLVGTVVSLQGSPQMNLSQQITPGAIIRRNEPVWDGFTCSGPDGRAI